MQLSIEAIIVLVIAIVLLGLGIGFIRSFFTQGESGLGEYFDPIQEGCQVDAHNVILPKEFSMKPGSTTLHKVCVYNNRDAQIIDGVFGVRSCMGPDGTDATALITFGSLEQSIDRGQAKGYKIPIAVSREADLGTYICNIYVKQKGRTYDDNTVPVIGPEQVSFLVE